MSALRDPHIPPHVVTERILLAALREQDAAAAAELARTRAQFLADASLRFGSSLDQEITYAAIAELALPGLDAWCIVDVVEIGGGLRRLAVVHPDEDKQAVARGLADRWTPTSDDAIGVPAVARDRATVIVTERAAAVVADTARDSETRSVLQQLGAGSLLIVPAIAHDILFGAITFVSRAGAPPYAPEEVALAEALAARCGQALEAARLYAAARAASAEAMAARMEAEAANAAKAQFLNRMSHELRTPLNAIAGYADLIEMGVRGPVTVEQQIDLGRIKRNQAHLLGLVERVLHYAQIEAGRVVYATDDISLADIVSGVEVLIAPQMRTRSLEYSFDAGDAPLRARADPEKVRQIVLNLIGNATKFTRPGGKIAVSCGYEYSSPSHPGDERRGMAAVRVEDTGIGIPRDMHERIFGPFVQVDRPPTSANAGVGLGLSISRELARGMGGDLTVESTPGEGSTFTLTLPAS